MPAILVLKASTLPSSVSGSIITHRPADNICGVSDCLRSRSKSCDLAGSGFLSAPIGRSVFLNGPNIRFTFTRFTGAWAKRNMKLFSNSLNSLIFKTVRAPRSSSATIISPLLNCPGPPSNVTSLKSSSRELSVSKSSLSKSNKWRSYPDILFIAL